MDPSSFSPATVKLKKASCSKPPLVGEITYDPVTRTVKLDPDDPHLHSGRAYRATILGGPNGVKSASGETFGESKVRTFKVR